MSYKEAYQQTSMQGLRPLSRPFAGTCVIPSLSNRRSQSRPSLHAVRFSKSLERKATIITTCNTEPTQQAEMTVVSLDAPESSTPQQTPRKRGRPRKKLENGAALTSKEVCDNLDHGSFQRLIYRSAVVYKYSTHSVPTSLERKQLF